MNRFHCQCDTCKKACKRPGWFMPGEAENAAKYLNMSLKKFFNTYLGVDWFENYKGTNLDIFVLAPVIKSGDPGTEYPADPEDTCIFFNNSLCDIHEVKPFECYSLRCGDDPETNFNRHKKVAQAWEKNEK